MPCVTHALKEPNSEQIVWRSIEQCCSQRTFKPECPMQTSTSCNGGTGNIVNGGEDSEGSWRETGSRAAVWNDDRWGGWRQGQQGCVTAAAKNMLRVCTICVCRQRRAPVGYGSDRAVLICRAGPSPRPRAAGRDDTFGRRSRRQSPSV